MNEKTQMGRARNAILSFLERRLSVPKIYLDAQWAGTQVEVLAVDRDGVGDVHVVLLFARLSSRPPVTDVEYEHGQISSLLGRLEQIPAQYKYIAGVDITELGSLYPFEVGAELQERSFAPDGLGRVGFFSIEVSRNDEPKVTLMTRPERFRADVGTLIDEYIHEHAADWEIRA